MLGTSTIETNLLTAKLLKHGIRHHKLCKAFSTAITHSKLLNTVPV